MALSREDILAELKRRGVNPEPPQYSREAILAELQKRGVQVPQPAMQAPPIQQPHQQAPIQQAQPQQGGYEDVPTDENLSRVAPKAPEPSLGTKIAGGLETALALGTGATTGALGYLYGAGKGLVNQISQGKFGTSGGANEIERQAQEQANRLTFHPQLGTGKKYTQAVGEALSPLQALGPMAPGVAPYFGGIPKAGQVAEVAAGRIATPIRQALPTGNAPALSPAEEVAIPAAKAVTAKVVSPERGARQLARQVLPDKKVQNAADYLGVKLQPDQYSNNPAYREFAQSLKSIPGSQGRAREIGVFQDVQQRANQIITDIGGTRDLRELSDRVKSNIQGLHDGLYESAGKAYDAVASQVPGDARAAVGNLSAELQQKAQNLGGFKFLDPLEKKLYNDLVKNENPTYSLLDARRRELTQARVKRTGSQAFSNADTGLIKHYENLLTADQKSTLEAVNPAALDTFEQAQKLSAQYKGLQENLVNIFGKKLDGTLAPKLRAAAQGIGREDIKQFNQVIKNVPENLRQEVVGGVLDYAFRGNVRNNELNFTNFSKWYENLFKNRENYKAFSQYIPRENIRQLNALYRVSKGISLSSKERITTGRLLAGDYFKRYAEKRANSIIGNVFGAVGGVTPEGAIPRYLSNLLKGRKNVGELQESADQLISSPAFHDFVVKGNGEASLVKSGPFRRFLNAAHITEDPYIWLANISNLQQRTD